MPLLEYLELWLGLEDWGCTTVYPPTGLEKAYNSILNGDVGFSELNNIIKKIVHTSLYENNIYLTIDDRIQRIVAKEYQDDTPDPTGQAHANHTYETYPTNCVSVIVSDPKTGEILAMLSSLGYDLNKMVQTLMQPKDPLSYYNQLKNDPNNLMYYRPTEGLYDSGSTFKTATLLGALDAGTTTLNQNWEKQQAYAPWAIPKTADSPGTTVYGDNLGYGQYVFHFPLTTEFGFADSNNIMFAHIGANMGEDKWLDYSKRLYFDQAVPSDLSVATSSVLQHDDKLTNVNFVNDAYGQGVDFVTPSKWYWSIISLRIMVS